MWRRGREPKASAGEAAHDETERLLDLAGFADGRLDDDGEQRIAALIVHDPDAATDVAAARALSGITPPMAAGRVIARAAALVTLAGQFGQIISFPVRQPAPPAWHGATAWSSLAAAIALASWLGFDLGSGMSLMRPYPDLTFEDAATSGLFDPAPPLLRDFTEGWQT